MISIADWLEHLEKLNPYKIDLGLDRVKVIAESLQLTKFSCPVITVTGTNGKGSCVAFLESIFSAAGYRVGAYTSPHLFRFQERIRINQLEIDDANLCAAFAAIESARKDIFLTYFEFTTLAALKIFQQANLDILILEIGLGGRLDAVNVVDADVAIITTVAIDHTDWLGKDRESIGQQKAAIFRPDKPAICGDFSPPQSVRNYATNINANLFCINQDFSYAAMDNHWDWRSKRRSLSHLPMPHLELQNAATALMAIEVLQPQLPVATMDIKTGLIRANLLGRWHRIFAPINSVFDVAHNPAAAKCLAARLRKEKIQGRVLAVVGMLADKDIAGTLTEVLPEVDTWFVGGLAGPRGTNAQLLVNTLQQLGAQKWYNCGSVIEAFKQAVTAWEQPDMVMVFGSFHTVSECLMTLKKEGLPDPGLRNFKT